MDRNGPEWASITGMDLKIHPKIHVLIELDKKFWFSNVTYQISSVPRLFQCKKYFQKYFLSYPLTLVPFLHQSPIMYECMQYGSLHSFFIVCASFYCNKIVSGAAIVKTLKKLNAVPAQQKCIYLSHMGYLCQVTQMGLTEQRLKNDINIFI